MAVVMRWKKMMVTCLPMRILTYKPGMSLTAHACIIPIPVVSDTDEVGGDIGITDDKKVILERVRMNTRKEYLEGGGTSSVRATDRLMRELQDIYRSKCLKDGNK
jgi:hypothetical protein